MKGSSSWSSNSWNIQFSSWDEASRKYCDHQQGIPVLCACWCTMQSQTEVAGVLATTYHDMAYIIQTVCYIVVSCVHIVLAGSMRVVWNGWNSCTLINGVMAYANPYSTLLKLLQIEVKSYNSHLQDHTELTGSTSLTYGRPASSPAFYTPDPLSHPTCQRSSLLVAQYVPMIHPRQVPESYCRCQDWMDKFAGAEEIFMACERRNIHGFERRNIHGLWKAQI